MTSILFGSISTLADTSELQREAFNEAFADHGLDWHWDREDYQEMLRGNGGADRVAAYAEQRGETVDAAAVHATKSAIFQKKLAAGVEPRDGVVRTITDAKQHGAKLALVTTTSAENVEALLSALGSHVDREDFDLVLDKSQVRAVKPDAAAYAFALDHLGERGRDAIAVEDNTGGVASAVGAGLKVVAFPNANTAGHDFGEATARVERLDFAELQRLATPDDAA